MSTCELHYSSPALKKQISANVILPEGQGSGPFPVFYLLHGLSDDHTIWMRRTSIERYIQDLPLIVVMPDGGRGFYCNLPSGPAYESAIIRDLIPYIDSIFRTRAERRGRCIGGLSMGGYGALKLALKYPDLFCSAHSHSGALHFAHGAPAAYRAEFHSLYTKKSKAGNDLYLLSRKPIPHKPALRIDCGLQDHLLKSSRQFHAHLRKLKYPHEYEEYPGAHDWNYWDLHIRKALHFHCRYLGINPPSAE